MKKVDFLLRAGKAFDQRVLFRVGQTVVTRSAVERLEALGLEPRHLIERHQTGDWGDVDDSDRRMNEESLLGEQRFFSSYQIEHERFWVLTTADRSRTLVFLPGRPPDPPPNGSPNEGWG